MNQSPKFENEQFDVGLPQVRDRIEKCSENVNRVNLNGN